MESYRANTATAIKSGAMGALVVSEKPRTVSNSQCPQRPALVVRQRTFVLAPTRSRPRKTLTVSSLAAIAAASTVFNTLELLELILANLALATLLHRAQLVCKGFKFEVDSSPTLARDLWRKPACLRLYSTITLKPRFDRFIQSYREDAQGARMAFEASPEVWEELSKTSLARALVRQPVVKRAQLSVVAVPYGHQKRGAWFLAYKAVNIDYACAEGSEGLKFGLLLDLGRFHWDLPDDGVSSRVLVRVVVNVVR